MPEQLCFAGFGVAPPPRDGVFFAIFPAAVAAAQTARLAQRLHDGRTLKGKPLSAERLHISLHNLGGYRELPHGVIAAASEAAACVAVPPFQVQFDRVLSFRGKPSARALVLCGGDGVAALINFQQALGVAMAKARLGRLVQSDFTPHVTLLYGDQSVDEQMVVPIGWTVREFVLVHSLRGRTRYIPLARWALRG